MRIDEYPPQEPFSPAGAAYAEEVMRRGGEIACEDYWYGEDPYQGIGVHVADNPNGTVLAFVHGGGWTSGYKEHMNFMAPAFTQAGVTFVTLGYRLAPQHTFPAGVEDIAAGLAWLYRNVGRFGGNSRRIFVGGHSAGGHYTPLLAVRRDWQAGYGLPQDAIRGCLPVSGVYEFGEGSGLSARPRFLGDDPENDRRASPIHNIQGRPPPFFMAHGSDDFPHLITQAQRMEQALKAVDGAVERVVLEGRNHFSTCYAAGEREGPLVPRMLAWMAAH
jgi:acetyl esterase/lipase